VESSIPRRVLIVAYRTAAPPALLEAVRDRAARAPVCFTLLVPRLRDAGRERGDASSRSASR
jgi:hypothetical protein